MTSSRSPNPLSPSTGQPFGHPLSLVESPVQEEELAVQTLKRLESINIRCQLQWEKHMKDIDPKRRYRKVSVLMIHWEKEGNDSFDAQKEVDSLGNVFRDKYRFRVTERKLNTEKGAQLQINKHLSNFVCDEDDENTLFIIYYAGHGTPDQSTGRLLLANGNLSASDGVSDHLNSIVWQEAERLIHTASRPDIFLILDCCHAGRLLNMRYRPAWSERIFEFLGATGPDGTTPLPGKESFTSALIWALESLAIEGARFMSSELLDKILQAPNFHRDGQVPCMSGRGPHCVRKLILETMAPEAEQSSSNLEGRRDEASEQFKYCLNLQFLLPDAPGDNDIKRMCHSLRELIVSHGFYARQILWQGLYPKEHARSEFPRLVREYATRWENRTLKKKIRTLSRGRSQRGENCLNDAHHGKSPFEDGETIVAITPRFKRAADELDAADSEMMKVNSPNHKKLRRAST